MSPAFNDRLGTMLVVFFLVVGLLGRPEEAVAVDGVIELSQQAALAGGVTSGDTPGFPITISETGSYRLTGNLDANGPTVIRITGANDVTVDLNGFSVLGDSRTSDDGIIITNTSVNVEVRNGTIRGFGRHGVFALSTSVGVRLIDLRAIDNEGNGFNVESPGALIRGCTVSGSGSAGIRALSQGLVLGNTLFDNGGVGLTGSTNTGYGKNVITGNNGGNANSQVSSGIDLQDNVCGTDTTCP